MKKLLVATLVLVVAGASAAFADEPTTYTEQFIQRHTQRIVDREKELQKQQKAREDARLKRQKEFENQIEASRKARLQRQKDFEDKIEADRKARQNEINARKQKYERKRQLWNELISD